MNELFDSASRFAFAMSLFGAKQIRDSLNVIIFDGDKRKTKASFETVTDRAEMKLSGGLKQVHQVGEHFQRGAVDLICDAVSPKTLNARGMVRMSFNFMQNAANVLKFILPCNENRLAWQEIQNKLTAFDWFENVDVKLSLPSEVETPLIVLLKWAEKLDSFNRVWATEGIGFLFAERQLALDKSQHGLLRGISIKGVSVNCLVALHAGMGLSLAGRLLNEMNTEKSLKEKMAILTSRIVAFEENLQEGYLEIVIETLGLAARNLYPHLLMQLDEALRQISESYPDYFWHGVGRALYFAPTGFIPTYDMRWDSILATQTEPPYESARLNALTGWIWALTLVNIRQPEILSACLKHHANLFTLGNAITNGISSAMVIWQESTGGDPSIESFLSYTPDDIDTKFVSLWHERVQRPSIKALREYQTTPMNERRLGKLFRYRQRDYETLL